MKNKLKKFHLAIIVLCMIMGTFPPMQTQAAARLNKEDVTMYPGDTLQLKVKGSSKKFKWKSDNKRVATVNQKGKVTAKSEGSATIYAERGYVTLICFIEVEFNDKEAAENVKVESLVTNNTAIALVKNDNNVDLYVTVSFALYDKYGKIVDTEELGVYATKENVCALRTDSYEGKDIKSVKTSISEIYKPSYTNQPQYIKVSESNTTKDKVSVKVKNIGRNKFEETRITCIFLKNNLPVGCEREIIYNFVSGAVKYISFDIPSVEKYGYDEDGFWDLDYANIDYDRWMILVDYAIYD